MLDATGCIDITREATSVSTEDEQLVSCVLPDNLSYLAEQPSGSVVPVAIGAIAIGL